jgi:hypothetical protein
MACRAKAQAEACGYILVPLNARQRLSMWAVFAVPSESDPFSLLKMMIN